MAQALHEFKQTNVEALVNGQQRLQALLDSIDDGLLIVDRDGRLEHANPVAQRQLAWENEHLGSTLWRSAGLSATGQRRAGTDDKPLSDPPEDLVIEADGERRLLAWRISPVSHHDGSISGAVMVLHDVTDQRTFERVRNEFVLRASHELRTPVTGMQMPFSLLRERLRYPADSRESDLFDTVHEQRLVRLINDLLNSPATRAASRNWSWSSATCRSCSAARQRFEVNAAEQDVQLAAAAAANADARPPADRAGAGQPAEQRPAPHAQGRRGALAGAASWRAADPQRRGQRRRACSASRHASSNPSCRSGRRRGGAGLGLALCGNCPAAWWPHWRALADRHGTIFTWRCRSDGAPSRNLPCRV